VEKLIEGIEMLHGLAALKGNVLQYMMQHTLCLRLLCTVHVSQACGDALEHRDVS
jgi:hypothetical protein